MKFHPFSGDVNVLQYGGKWISDPQSNTEFTYYVFLELINWEEAVGEREAKSIGAKYAIECTVVAPSEVDSKELLSAFQCIGHDGECESLNDLLYALDAYGAGKAVVFQFNGNNAHKMLAEAKQRASCEVGMLFGFVMDRAQNAIGSTGWDCLRGDILAGLRRHNEDSEQEEANSLMRKIGS